MVSEQPPWNQYVQQQDQPPYQGQPYQGQQGQQGQPYQGQAHQGQHYQPYQGQPYQGQGQPYQGHQGQPYQGQPQYRGQPSGPPGGQAPSPGPVNGPQPPPRRKRHTARNILAGIGSVIVAGIVISALSSHSGGVSTTASGSSTNAGSTSSPATTRQAAPARIGSYFDVQDASGDTYKVTLAKVIDPAQGAGQFDTPDNGNRFVGVVFTIKALSDSPQDEDANDDAAVVGSNGQTYTTDLDNIAGYTNFSNGEIDVAQGDTTTGAVVFQVPDGIKVTEVQWSSAAGFGSTVQWDVRH